MHVNALASLIDKQEELMAGAKTKKTKTKKNVQADNHSKAHHVKVNEVK
jgi:hypothetical protein